MAQFLGELDLKLLPFQEPIAEKVGTVVAENHSALLAAATGVGKTYCAAHIIREFEECGIKAAVICPKIAIPNWQNVLNGFGVGETPVINYEKARTRWVRWVLKNTKSGKYSWPIPCKGLKGRLVVFDESHRCGGDDSQNAKLLAAASDHCYTLQMSATPADNPLRMRAMVTALGIVPYWENFWTWAKLNGCRSNGRGGLQFTKSERKGSEIMGELNSQLFPAKGQLVTVNDCAEYFNENRVMVECLPIPGVADVWNQVLEEFQQKCFINQQQMQNFRLAMRMRARAEVEKLKVPVLAELAQDAMDCGYSVPIFLNFTEPILALAEKLKIPAIWGGDKAADRQKAIEAFQAGDVRGLVINIAAGAEAVSLHDLVGDRPRLSLINPSELGTAVAQVLGRVHRVGAKSPATQKLVLAADSVEEQVAANLNRKLGNLGALTDSDLQLI